MDSCIRKDPTNILICSDDTNNIDVHSQCRAERSANGVPPGTKGCKRDQASSPALNRSECRLISPSDFLPDFDFTKEIVPKPSWSYRIDLSTTMNNFAIFHDPSTSTNMFNFCEYFHDTFNVLHPFNRTPLRNILTALNIPEEDIYEDDGANDRGSVIPYHFAVESEQRTITDFRVEPPTAIFHNFLGQYNVTSPSEAEKENL